MAIDQYRIILQFFHADNKAVNCDWQGQSGIYVNVCVTDLRFTCSTCPLPFSCVFKLTFHCQIIFGKSQVLLLQFFVVWASFVFI